MRKRKLLAASIVLLLTSCGSASASSSQTGSSSSSLPTSSSASSSASSSSSSNGGSDESSSSSSSSEEILETDSSWTVLSQDKTLRTTIYLEEGKAFYDVTKDGNHIIEKSELGFNTDEADFSSGLTFGSRTRESKSISYDVKSGKKSHVDTYYSQVVTSFSKGNYFMDVALRAYDDGYAFRYTIRQKDAKEVLILLNDEITSFALPASSTTYVMTTPSFTERFEYEKHYTRKKSDKLNNAIVSMPFLYKTSEDVWSLISESQLIGSDYHGSFLLGDENGTMHIKPAYLSETTNITYTSFTSPWRAGIVGGLDTITESTLIEDLYDEAQYYKPDNYDELTDEQKKTYDYEWVTPYKSAWTWLTKGSNTQTQWEENKRFIKMASEKGYGWFLIDAGWVPYSTELRAGFDDMMAYAKSLGVKMACWAHSYNDLGTVEKMKYYVPYVKGLGFDGMKVDFFDGLYDNTGSTRLGESQHTISLYEDLYQITAEYEMVLNIHGANKPTGERRVYPHVLSREAVRGNEYRKNVVIDDCVTIPFIRGVVGPSDYTPSLKPFDSNTTVGSQMAMHFLYESGILTMGDSPENYAAYPEASAVLDSMPVAFDDIKYISGDPLDSAVIARRKGADWYVAGINIYKADYEIDLSTFLSPNNDYQAEVFTDGDTYLDLDYQTSTVAGSDVMKVKTADKGGFVIKLVQK